MSALIAVLAIGAVFLSEARDRRDKRYEEPKSQVTALPRELPMVLAADTAGLSFYASPLQRTGGLTAQIRHALSDVLREARGKTVIKLRAFVAGAGDSRRVQSEVSDLFSHSKSALPVLTILQVGSLGEEFAQVAIEAVLASGQALHPYGLVFFPSQEGKSLAQVQHHLLGSATKVGLSRDDILSCTCYAARLSGLASDRSQLQSAFPHAAVTLVQPQRDPIVERSSCEAVGRPRAPLNASPSSAESARAQPVRSPRLVFTGLQLSFGSYLDDAKQAFSRLQKAAATLDGSTEPVEVNSYSLDLTSGAAIRKSTAVSATAFSNQTVEGLPSVDAAAGIEAVLVVGSANR